MNKRRGGRKGSRREEKSDRRRCGGKGILQPVFPIPTERAIDGQSSRPMSDIRPSLVFAIAITLPFAYLNNRW